jgi:hypothetical protein
MLWQGWISLSLSLSLAFHVNCIANVKRERKRRRRSDGDRDRQKESSLGWTTLVCTLAELRGKGTEVYTTIIKRKSFLSLSLRNDSLSMSINKLNKERERGKFHVWHTVQFLHASPHCAPLQLDSYRFFRQSFMNYCSGHCDERKVR